VSACVAALELVALLQSRRTLPSLSIAFDPNTLYAGAGGASSRAMTIRIECSPEFVKGGSGYFQQHFLKN
jgi:hypothetical protein